MLLGSKTTFAIEFEVDDPPALDAHTLEQHTHYVFGKMCFWVEDSMVGNYELGGVLGVATANFTPLLRNKGSRRDPDLWSKPAEIVYKTIDDALYVDSGQTDEQVSLDAKKYGKFIATPNGFDVFDDWKAYLIQGDTSARYIWKQRYDEGIVHEALLGVDEFDLRLQEFVDWFNINYGKRQ
ncbi:MAG: Imm42 family immunity protein [Chloroflexota bacterium]